MKAHLLFRTRNRTALAAATTLLLVAGSRPVAAQSPAPGDTWPRAIPAEVGLDGAVLDSIDAEIRAGDYGYVDRFLVVRNGRIAYDRRYEQDYDKAYGDSARDARYLRTHDLSGPYNYYNAWWHPWYRRGNLHTLQSVTKTVTSVIIGAAVTRGEFPSVDTPVLSYFDEAEVANIDERKRRMTVRHLLTMTAGLDWDENRPYTDPENTAIGLEAAYDWIDYTIDRPMMEEPGARFNYNSGASQLLAHIFHEATGLDVEEYAARHLFGPLGIQDWFWKRTPAGIPDTEGGLFLAAEDLARIWLLFVRKGDWNGRRVISADWVAESIKPAIHVGPPQSGVDYGFKWWLYRNPVDTSRTVLGGSGFGGQVPLAVPEDDLIVVFNQWNILPDQRGLPAGIALRRILRSIRP